MGGFKIKMIHWSQMTPVGSPKTSSCSSALEAGQGRHPKKNTKSEQYTSFNKHQTLCFNAYFFKYGIFMLTTAKSAAFGVWNRYRLVCKVLNKSLFCLRWRNLENNQLPTHQSTQPRGSKPHVWQCMKTEMLKTRDEENARGPYWSASRLYILVNILKFKPSAGCHKSICFKREKRIVSK